MFILSDVQLFQIVQIHFLIEFRRGVWSIRLVLLKVHMHNNARTRTKVDLLYTWHLPRNVRLGLSSTFFLAFAPPGKLIDTPRTERQLIVKQLIS